MAHWAKLDSTNVVTEIVVTANEMPNEGYDWLISALGGKWVQTSYNTYGGKHLLGGTPLRKNYAGIGFIYDEQRDAFIPPKPLDSWILNQDTCLWEAPVPYPSDGKNYFWSEEQGDWLEVEIPSEE